MPQPLTDYRRELEEYLAAQLPPAARIVATTVVAHINVDDERPQMFSILVCHDGVTALRYDLASAFAAGAAAVGALAGSPTKVQVAAAVIAGLLALRGVRKVVPDNVARVVLALYARRGCATVEEIKELAGAPPLSEGDIEDAVRQLKAMEAITTDAGVVQLRETVTARYASLPRITPA